MSEATCGNALTDRPGFRFAHPGYGGYGDYAALTTSTPTFSPAVVATLISASRLNLLMRPRSRSFSRGWVRPSRLAVAACVRPQAATVSRIAIIIAARAFMLAACAREGSIASHTLANRCFFIALLTGFIRTFISVLIS